MGELDPLPHAPQHHGSGHRGVLRRFFQKYRGLGSGGDEPQASVGPKAAAAAATTATAAAATDQQKLKAEAQRLFISVRVLSGALGSFDYERFALERRRREAVACAAAQDAAAAGADAAGIAAAAAAAVKAATLTVGDETEGITRWARPMGWWARTPHGAPRLTA